MGKLRWIAVLVVIALLALISGCGSGQATTPSSSYRDISADELNSKIDQGEELQIIDVREAYEFANGHIKGSVNIPSSELQSRYETINKDRESYLICASGARSLSATEYLAGKGYTKVFNVTGGLAGYPGELEK